MTAPLVPDRYIGDGVYASFDGCYFWLDLRGQGDGHVKIALEPSVLRELDRFRVDVAAALARLECGDQPA